MSLEAMTKGRPKHRCLCAYLCAMQRRYTAAQYSCVTALQCRRRKVAGEVFPLGEEHKYLIRELVGFRVRMCVVHAGDEGLERKVNGSGQSQLFFSLASARSACDDR